MPRHNVIIRNGWLYDGTGRPAIEGGLAIDGDRIAVVGDVTHLRGTREIDADGLAVAPGFINMLSWATEALLEDGHSQSDLRQGVTLEVFGEGESMGPLTPAMREIMLAEQGDIRYAVPWTTLGQYLDHLVDRGVSCNVASLVGATTVRIHELGYVDRPPTAVELGRMRSLVQAAMVEGALGVGSSLIYAPACYATTDELVSLAAESVAVGGLYASHIRSEGDRLVEGIDELLEVAARSGSRAEIYHLKAMGETGAEQFDAALERIEWARGRGLTITADMYPYAAAATGLDAAMPPWVQEGGLQAWIGRLRDPETRQRVAAEMRHPRAGWENQLLLAAGPDGVLLVGFKNDALKVFTGRTLAEVAASRGTSPEETAMDLVVEDGSRVSTIYFNQREAIVDRILGLPWVSIGSDAPSVAPEGVFLRSNPHPRAYGTFARVLGEHVRDERRLSLEEAVRRMTSLPAANLRLARRGRLAVGAFADVVVFDPQTIRDRATFDAPHAYAIGVAHVFVNGVHTVCDGEHTGAKAGRVVPGPGWAGRGTRGRRAAAG